MAVMSAPVCSVYLGRDDDLYAACFEDIDDALLSIISPVGEQRTEAPNHLRQQGIGAMQIVEMPRGQVEGDRIAQGIAQRMELGA